MADTVYIHVVKATSMVVAFANSNAEGAEASRADTIRRFAPYPVSRIFAVTLPDNAFGLPEPEALPAQEVTA